MSHEEDQRITESSGNVFADLGFPDAQERCIEAKIASRISDIIEERGLTQAQAAEILGVDQPKVSALIRGRLSGFSIERLFRFLNALDMDIEIRISKGKDGGGCDGLHVIVAAG